ncbi:AMP-dependent synthetase and ligase [Halovivax asiaticus JCM 14624]|uniref:AMP-dependent synthetase and ligase n=1 Tax=Halovivax asiaticus JCM 14624 TaxID=1227490 RepID=M0BR80_9EURY|nr:AMP-binding protein [Halovivax asiaticus]ELZ12617.1 AMP-dependent synthetase and ligase [Halovivax asiaticus JCM 14624]
METFDKGGPETIDWEIPPEYTVASAVEEHAATVGDRVALSFLSETGDRAERTYADIRDEMHRFANGLDQLGVGMGDRVMHLFPRHPDAFAVQLGALSVGALLVPCSAMLQPADIEFRATDCAAETIVVHESLTDMVEPVLAESPIERVIVLDRTGAVADDRWTTVEAVMDDQSTAYDGPDVGAEDPMSINYTSGTTGKPKPVLHKHRWQYCFNRVNARHWWGIDEKTDLDDELLWATTGTGWAKWFWSPVGVGLTTGASQFIYDGDFEPKRFLEVLEAEGVTRLCAVPTQYRMFASADLESYDVQVTDALSAGEPLNREPIERIEAAWGVTPRDGYGQTETVALVLNTPEMEVKPGSMGKPSPGIETTILDVDDEVPVEPCEIGEIAVPIDSPAIFDGYYEKPHLDDRTFSGEYYRTGDLASMDEDGSFFFEGRADDIIISAGYRIGPFEVEDALVSHDAVAEAAAVDSPHDERGSVVKAYIVLSDGATASDELKTELQEFMKAETAPYKYPRRIEFVDELPKTSSGKIRRIELREKERARFG